MGGVKHCNTIVYPLNISGFEVDPQCDIDSLIGDNCDSADIIIIRLGENVKNSKIFKENFQRLITKCKNITENVIITGMFWRKPEVEKILFNHAKDNNLQFVPLNWIPVITEAYPQKGDTLYNVEGDPYVITKKFIISHPNDRGMEEIAKAIFRSIQSTQQ